jgi:hypothetical protein
LAYGTLFIGAIHFEPWELIWNSWVPKKCQYFIWLGLVDQDRQAGSYNPQKGNQFFDYFGCMDALEVAK